jgi:hyaluronoglucosaminidase
LPQPRHALRHRAEPLRAVPRLHRPAKADFAAKLRALDEIGIDDLAILFDDTRGDVPDLAAREAEIVHAALATTRASRVVMCPTYYSDDRMLDVVFGERPSGYLDDLGRRLDPRVGVYWTGEEICAREFSPGHLARVAESLQRKPTLWDNYPVNDGPQMSRFLHLRGFTGRPARDRAPHRGACHQPGAAAAPEPDSRRHAGGQLSRGSGLPLHARLP